MEIVVITYMYYVCSRLNVSSHQLFRIAYKHKYGVDGDTRNAYSHFLTHKELPDYVVNFLEHLRDNKSWL